jgi:Ulp1 family protease
MSLSEDDLSTLDPHQWVNDSVINAWRKIVNEKYANVNVLNTHFLSAVYNRSSPKDRIILDRLIKKQIGKKSQAKKLLFPINFGCHWILYEADLNSGNVTRWDSFLETLKEYYILNTKEPHIFVTMLNFILPSMKNYMELDFDQFTFVGDAEAPQQKNENDCGVFVCVMIEGLSISDTITDDTMKIPKNQWQMYMEKFRTKLKETLKSKNKQ